MSVISARLQHLFSSYCITDSFSNAGAVTRRPQSVQCVGPRDSWWSVGAQRWSFVSRRHQERRCYMTPPRTRWLIVTHPENLRSASHSSTELSSRVFFLSLSSLLLSVSAREDDISSLGPADERGYCTAGGTRGRFALPSLSTRWLAGFYLEPKTTFNNSLQW